MKNLLFILIMIAGIPCFPQKDSIVIKGIVYDEQNCEPIVFADVKVDVNDYRYDNFRTTTDMDGKFKMKIPKFLLSAKKPILFVHAIDYACDTIYLKKVTDYKKDIVIYGRSYEGVKLREPEDVFYEYPNYGQNVTREEYSKMQSLYPTPNVQFIQEYYNEKNKLFKTIKTNPNYIEGQGIVHITRFNSDSLPTSAELYSDYRVDTAVYHYYEKISWDKKKRMIKKLTWTTNNDRTVWKEKYDSNDNRIYYAFISYNASAKTKKGFRGQYFYKKNEKRYYKSIIENFDETEK